MASELPRDSTAAFEEEVERYRGFSRCHERIPLDQQAAVLMNAENLVKVNALGMVVHP